LPVGERNVGRNSNPERISGLRDESRRMVRLRNIEEIFILDGRNVIDY
jgi:hypothetical protein